MLPSIDNLRCFTAGAQTLNFRAAARLVALTPAAFGQRIKQLEDQLGVALFHRTTRTVSLTSAGLALVPYAQRALESMDACARAARGELGPMPSDLVLGTRHELGLSWVLPQMERLQRELSHLTLHLYFGSGDDLLLRIRTREIDCAVTSTRFTDPKLDAIRLHREDYVFVGSHQLLRGTPFTRPEHAAQHTLIDVGAEMPLFRYWRDAPGAHPTMKFARILRIGTIAAIEAYVLAGRGVAVLPRYLVESCLAQRRMREIFPKIRPVSDYFRLVFRVDDARRPVFEALASSMVRQPLS